MAASSTSTHPSFVLPQNLLTHKSQQLESLHEHYKLLHLLHHRNKNQHRRSIWYRHFNTLRRQLKSLLAELCIDLGTGFKRWGDGARASGSAYRKRRKADGAREARLQKHRENQKDGKKNKKHKYKDIALHGPTNKEKESMSFKASTRLGMWVREGFVERWYTAFTSLLPTPSSAPLALTLLGLLARVCSLTGVTAHIEAIAEHEHDRQLELDQEHLQINEAIEIAEKRAMDAKTESAGQQAKGGKQKELVQSLGKLERTRLPGMPRKHEWFEGADGGPAESEDDDVGEAVDRDEIAPEPDAEIMVSDTGDVPMIDGYGGSGGTPVPTTRAIVKPKKTSKKGDAPGTGH